LAAVSRGSFNPLDALAMADGAPPPNPKNPLHLLPRPLQTLAQRGTERRYKRGTILMQEGDPGGALYFITHGLLRAYSARDDGQEFTFGFYGPGEYMGEMSLDGGPRSASVMVEQAAVCLVVLRKVLEDSIAADPELAFALLTKVIRRARDLSTRARDLALNDAYGRLVLLLHAGSVVQADGSRWMVNPLTQEQLSQQLGCSRTMVTKLLGDLAKGGYVQQDQRRWRILRALPHRY